MEKPIIVCVDDEKSVLNGLRDELKFELGTDFSIEIADSGEEGLNLVQEIMQANIEIPVIISDQLMPGMKGDEFLASVNQINTHIRKILLTGQASAEAVGNAVNKAQLYRYIAKPWDAKDLVMTVNEAARSYFLNQELSARVQLLSDLNQSLEILSDEVRLDHLVEHILRLALRQTNAPIAALSLMVGSEVGRVFWAEAGKPVLYTDTSFEPWLAVQPLIQQILTFPEAVHSGKAFREDPWRSLPYVKERKLKSFYGSPILRQGDLLGVLYVEQADKPNEMNPMRVDYLRALTKQSAISLDKALLYKHLDNRVQERTHEIEKQKAEIEAINTDLLDSIHYARRIQNALLSSKEVLTETFPNSFIIYHPKDIVSGDFYWLCKIDSYIFAAVVDCTGHGVPGAFMSVLGSTHLNEIVLQQQILEPTEILSELNRRVIQNLGVASNEELPRDGMEVALVRIDLQHRQFVFSGANRPGLFFESHEQWSELPYTRRPIGYNPFAAPDAQNAQFDSVTKNYQAGQSLYLFSDGVTDQFGSQNSRKLTRRAFIEIVSSFQLDTMQTQAEEIEGFLNAWKGNLQQTDDICVIGIQF